MRSFFVGFTIAGLLCIFASRVLLVLFPQSVSLVTQPTPAPTPLSVYRFESLRQTTFDASPLSINEKQREDQETKSFVFSWDATVHPVTQEKKRVSGLLTAPQKPGIYPIILLLRGYVPPTIYKPGLGSDPIARYLASRGFVTIAPDFLGFGTSASRSADPYEARFQTYTTTLSLIASLSSLPEALEQSLPGTRVQSGQFGIWGHSNGGHIALATLEITGKNMPTVLWAPVSKGFPYAVLAFTDEDEDGGRDSRRELARFESLYQASEYSIDQYFHWITAPLEIHQGGRDREVPYWWSDDLRDALEKSSVSATLYRYPQADHNLRPDWELVAERTASFFSKRLVLGQE